jgi:hypothetical protein
MHLDLTDEQVALLLAELDRLIENGRYPLSARIRALRGAEPRSCSAPPSEIRTVLKPYPERPPPSAPQKRYEPPSRGQYRKRRG